MAYMFMSLGVYVEPLREAITRFRGMRLSENNHQGHVMMRKLVSTLDLSIFLLQDVIGSYFLMCFQLDALRQAGKNGHYLSWNLIPRTSD